MPDAFETPELSEAELLAINIDAYKRQCSMIRINVSEAIKDHQMPDTFETPDLSEAELLAINIDAYKRQIGMTRINVSEAIKDLMEYVESSADADHLLHPKKTLDKDNPWVEKKACTIL